MQTYSNPLQQALQGLRASKDNVRDNPQLLRCLNLKPYPDGLRPFEDLPMPLLRHFPVEDRTFPFPQLFKGVNNTFALDKDAIYTVTDDFDIAELGTYDSLGAPKNILPGASWQFIDMGKSWIFLNGSCIVYKENEDFLGSGNVIVNDTVAINAGCKFRGRLITSFNPGGVWGGIWRGIFESYRRRLPDEFEDVPYTLDSNFVIYSSIGTSDFAFDWLLNHSRATAGYTTQSGFTLFRRNEVDRTLLAEALRKNEFGFIPMPWRGKPLAIKAIGENISGAKGAVIIYGADGITALIPYSDPVPTFGMRHIHNVGIKSRSSVGGDDFEHVFVDKAGVVFKLGLDLKVTPLGYNEFFESQENLVISHKPSLNEREYYISSSKKGYTLTNTGLGEQNQLITSVITVNGKDYATASLLADNALFLETDIIKDSREGYKTSQQVHVNCDNTEDLMCAISYRYKPQDPFLTTHWIPFNDRGIATVTTCAPEYKILIQQIPKGTKIFGVTDWWQGNDLRGIRGPDAATSNTQ